ncbi:MAG: iron-sulfur cluster assembly accessory protein [Myxococcota bacterium]
MALLAIQRKGQHRAKGQRLHHVPSQPVSADALHITQRAAARIVQEAAQQEGCNNPLLRVAVEGGGCSGFRCRFDWEGEPKQDDCLFCKDKARVCVDPKSMRVLGGSTLDWRQELGRSGFRVLQARRTSTCSCGQSFTLL